MRDVTLNVENRVGEFQEFDMLELVNAVTVRNAV